jgi:hypothetical protein
MKKFKIYISSKTNKNTIIKYNKKYVQLGTGGYSRGRDQEDCGLKPTLANSL